MSLIIFIYNSLEIPIPFNENELVSSIVQRFCLKVNVDHTNLSFLYNGFILNEQLIVNSMHPDNENKIKILVNNNQTQTMIGPYMKKCDSIICPECKESSIITIKDYHISFSQCKNGHNIENILLDKFNETQNEDISKILCGKCNRSMNNIYANKMFICFDCKINLCSLCEHIHDKSHTIKDYEQKYYICGNDGENYTSYCKTCKKNLCLSCVNEHDNHDLVPFSALILNKNKLKQQNENLKKDIDKFKNLVNDIKNKLDKVSENLDIYFDINTILTNNSNKSYRNYEELVSLKEINNNNTIQTDINKIINDNNINNQIIGILDMYKKMQKGEEINNQNNLENENIIINENNETNNQNVNINISNNELSQNDSNKENNNNIINDISNNNSSNENQNIIINNNSNNKIEINNDNKNNLIENNNNNIIINNNEINTNNNNPNNNNINVTNIIRNIVDNINTNNNNIINNINNKESNNNINKINNISTNTNNNTTNSNINNNNANPVTPCGNNINSNEDIELTNSILAIEMENLIRNDMDQNTPLISDLLNISTLVDEYIENQQYINSVKEIANKYKSIRKIRRDGNCFYRGFIYRIFEYICINKNNNLFEKMIGKIELAKTLAKKNTQLDFIDEFYNAFFGEFCSCYNSGDSCRDYLDKLFHKNNKEKCNYLICFIRYSIAQYLRENKLLYEAYIEKDFEIYLETEVEQIDNEVDQIQIMAIVNLFDIGVKIEYLNKVKNEVIKYPEDINDNDIFINFLFRPGHYDLLYN